VEVNDKTYSSNNAAHSVVSKSLSMSGLMNNDIDNCNEKSGIKNIKLFKKNILNLSSRYLQSYLFDKTIESDTMSVFFYNLQGWI